MQFSPHTGTGTCAVAARRRAVADRSPARLRRWPGASASSWSCEGCPRPSAHLKTRRLHGKQTLNAVRDTVKQPLGAGRYRRRVISCTDVTERVGNWKEIGHGWLPALTATEVSGQGTWFLTLDKLFSIKALHFPCKPYSATNTRTSEPSQGCCNVRSAAASPCWSSPWSQTWGTHNTLGYLPLSITKEKGLHFFPCSCATSKTAPALQPPGWFHHCKASKMRSLLVSSGDTALFLFSFFLKKKKKKVCQIDHAFSWTGRIY